MIRFVSLVLIGVLAMLARADRPPSPTSSLAARQALEIARLQRSLSEVRAERDRLRADVLLLTEVQSHMAARWRDEFVRRLQGEQQIEQLRRDLAGREPGVVAGADPEVLRMPTPEGASTRTTLPPVQPLEVPDGH